MRKLGLEDPVFERDITVLILDYIKFQFWIDGLANLPVFVYDCMEGFSEDDG